MRDWSGGKSTLDRAIYSIDLRQVIANLLNPTPESRPTAEEVIWEAHTDNRQELEEEASSCHVM